MRLTDRGKPLHKVIGRPIGPACWVMQPAPRRWPAAFEAAAVAVLALGCYFAGLVTALSWLGPPSVGVQVMPAAAGPDAPEPPLLETHR